LTRALRAPAMLEDEADMLEPVLPRPIPDDEAD